MIGRGRDASLHTNVFIYGILNTLPIIDLIKTVLFLILTEAVISTQLATRTTRHQARFQSISPGSEKGEQEGRETFIRERNARFLYQRLYNFIVF